MNWTLLAPFLIESGVKAAMKLAQWSNEGKAVENADFDEINALAQKSKEEKLRESRIRLGLEAPPPPIPGP